MPALSAAASVFIASISVFNASIVGGAELDTNRRMRVNTDTPCFCRAAASAREIFAGKRVVLFADPSSPDCARRSAMTAFKFVRNADPHRGDPDCKHAGMNRVCAKDVSEEYGVKLRADKGARAQWHKVGGRSGRVKRNSEYNRQNTAWKCRNSSTRRHATVCDNGVFKRERQALAAALMDEVARIRTGHKDVTTEVAL
jgi:hypothetical protein